jgi:hypothetical protein
MTATPKKMPAITVGRYDEDPTALGVVRADDGSWQVVIDKDGFPVFYFRVQAEPLTEGGPPTAGWMCVDDMLPPEMEGVKGLMQGVFGQPCPEGPEADAAFEEFQQRIEAAGRPCPR